MMMENLVDIDWADVRVSDKQRHRPCEMEMRGA
jgi:hypothetical protein